MHLRGGVWVVIAVAAFLAVFPVSVCRAHPFVEGEIAFKRGDFQKAAEFFSQALRAEPDHSVSYNNRGVCYYKLGQYQLAIQDFKKALSLDPKAKNPSRELMTIYYDLGEYAQAREYVDLGIRYHPDAQVLHFGAMVYAKLEQHEKAVELSRRAISLVPGRANHHLELAFNLLKLSRYEEAHAAFLKARELAPNHSAVREYFARTDKYRGESTSSVQAGQSAVDIMDQADIQLKAGNHNAAAELYSKIIEKGEAGDGVYLARAEAWHKAMRPERAMQDVNVVLGKNPRNIRALRIRSKAFYTVKKYSEALGDLQAAKAFGARDPELYWAMGGIYMALQRHDRAMEILQEGLVLFPDVPILHNGLGSIHARMKQWEAAHEHFAKAVRDEPGNPRFYRDLASAQMHLKMFPECLEAANSGLEQQAKAQADADDSMTKGLLFFRAIGKAGLGRYREAEQDLTRAITLDPMFFQAYEARASVYSKLGESFEAASDRAMAISLKQRQVQ